ncbi:MAG: alpha/beta fold hydrolase [Methanomassiliicoccus sp.]|nr:alpha/beta fold hydrolase [Methanomassiliicoccus sp.]
MVYLRANGVVLNIELCGKGEPVLLISDIGEDLTYWSFQTGNFGRLHFLMRLDNRGSGWSDCPAEGWSIQAMARDMICTMDLVGVERAHVVGMGLGGMIALEMALQRPGRVGGLVLASSSARATVQQREVYGTLAMSARSGLDDAAISRSMVPWLYSAWFLENDRWREFVIRARASGYRGTSWAGFSAQFDAMLRFDVRERLPEIAAPTLVVSGGEDRLTPPSCSGELVSGIPDARRADLKAGHQLQVELPRSFNQAVLGFLAEVEGSPVPDLGDGMPMPCGGRFGL